MKTPFSSYEQKVVIHEETLTGIKLVEIFWRREIENKKKKKKEKKKRKKKNLPK